MRKICLRQINSFVDQLERQSWEGEALWWGKENGMGYWKEGVAAFRKLSGSFKGNLLRCGG